MGGYPLNFTDIQVLTLVRDHPGESLRGLVRIAKKEMPKWPWTVGKIQKSVQRLEKSKKVKVEKDKLTIEIQSFRVYGVHR